MLDPNMDDEFVRQIKEAEKEGWRLCGGCALYKSDLPCYCPMDTRKLMGIPPGEDDK